MFQQHIDKIKDSVQSGLNTIQQAVNTQNNSLSFIPSTLNLQKPTKSGWMKKTGGLLKGWHRKWFVLKSDYLLYYSSLNDNKLPQGMVFMPGSEVYKRDGKSNDSEKFIIDIFQEKAQVPVESLSVESGEERELWFRVFKELLYASLGGAIFGKSLDETLRFEKGRDPNRNVPEIVEACVEYLMKYAIEEEGIFRLPGRVTLVQRYAELYDMGNRPQLDGESGLDVNSVASLLKLYLIQLPTSLITPSHYHAIVGLVTQGIHEDMQESMQKLRQNLRQINTHHYTLLKYICHLLGLVSSRQEINKMTVSNLAVVFSNIFIRPPIDSLQLLMSTANVRNKVTHLLIANHEWLFDMEVTSFGEFIVIEDLLGIAAVDLDVDDVKGVTTVEVVEGDCGDDDKDGTTVEGVEGDFGDDGVVSDEDDDAENRCFYYLQNGGIRKSTFNDLMGLNFNVGKKLSQKSGVELQRIDVNNGDDNNGDDNGSDDNGSDDNGSDDKTGVDRDEDDKDVDDKKGSDRISENNDDYLNGCGGVMNKNKIVIRRSRKLDENILRINRKFIDNVDNNNRRVNFEGDDLFLNFTYDNKVPHDCGNLDGDNDTHDNDVEDKDDKNNDIIKLEALSDKDVEQYKDGDVDGAVDGDGAGDVDGCEKEYDKDGEDEDGYGVENKVGDDVKDNAGDADVDGDVDVDGDNEGDGKKNEGFCKEEVDCANKNDDVSENDDVITKFDDVSNEEDDVSNEEDDVSNEEDDVSNEEVVSKGDDEASDEKDVKKINVDVIKENEVSKGDADVIKINDYGGENDGAEAGKSNGEKRVVIRSRGIEGGEGARRRKGFNHRDGQVLSKMLTGERRIRMVKRLDPKEAK